MKKLFLLVICLAFVSTGVFAQEGLSIKVSFSGTNFTGDDNAKMKPGFKIGLGYDLALTDILYLQPSLAVAAKGAQYSEGIGNLSAKAAFNSLYIEIPVLFSAKFDMNIVKRRVFSFGVGPYVAYGISGTTTFSGGWGRFTASSGEPTFGDVIGMKRFDAGVAVGVGLELRNFIIGFDTQFGLVKLNTNLPNLLVNGNAKNFSATLSAGFRF